jgi:hypothetical protein
MHTFFWVVYWLCVLLATMFNCGPLPSPVIWVISAFHLRYL